MKHLLITTLLCLAVVFQSCSLYNIPVSTGDALPSEEYYGAIANETLHMELIYIGSTGYAYIFECHLTNLSEETVMIDNSMFTIEHQDGRTTSIVDKEDVTQELNDLRSQERKYAKSNLARGIFGISISAALDGISGLNGSETIASSIEPSVYILDQHFWHRRNIKDISSEISYVRRSGFSAIDIKPGITEVADLLFTREEIRGDIDVRLLSSYDNLQMTFPLSAFVH